MHPVGPLEPKVYWLRRVIVIAVAVILLIGLVWFVVARANSGASGPAPAADTAPTTTSAGLTGVLAPQSSAPAWNSGSAPAGSSGSRTAGPSVASGSREAAATSKPPVKSTGAVASTVAPSTSKAPSTTKAPATTKVPATTKAPSTIKVPATSTAPSTTKARATATPPSTTTAQPSASARPPVPTTDAQGRLLCTNSALALTTTVGAPEYRVGQTPILGVTVRNAGPAACVRDLSGALQVFTAYDSEGSRIWSTADCFPGAGTDVRLLQPGESLQYNIKWSGTTSQPGCTGDRLRVEAGTYTIVASVGGARATAAKLTFG